MRHTNASMPLVALTILGRRSLMFADLKVGITGCLNFWPGVSCGHSDIFRVLVLSQARGVGRAQTLAVTAAISAVMCGQNRAGHSAQGFSKPHRTLHPERHLGWIGGYAQRVFSLGEVAPCRKLLHLLLEAMRAPRNTPCTSGGQGRGVAGRALRKERGRGDRRGERAGGRASERERGPVANQPASRRPAAVATGSARRPSLDGCRRPRPRLGRETKWERLPRPPPSPMSVVSGPRVSSQAIRPRDMSTQPVSFSLFNHEAKRPSSPAALGT